MKVYARYFSQNGLNLRTNTILQFGESFDIIGAAVLINPGSAKPLNKPLYQEQLHLLSSITGKFDHWQEFSIDSTMRHLEKIFDNSYIEKKKMLNGIILLFNLFNLREQHLDNALKLKDNCNCTELFTTDKDLALMQNISKIYLGWGNTGKDETLRPYSQRIFDAVKNSQSFYINPLFEMNKFYHPGYVNRSYKQNSNTINILKDFSSK